MTYRINGNGVFISANRLNKGIQMRKNVKKQRCSTQSKEEFIAENRRNKDRRLCEKKGFTYIPVVGWMCRREKTRRKDDDICGW